jgi:Ca2+-binding RTX toxin-like protein
MVNVILGTSKDDRLAGTANEDAIYGMSGNDTIDGSTGNDILSGGGQVSSWNSDNLSIKQAFKGQIVLETPKNGSVNPVGMYKIDAAGNITDVKIIWNGGVSGSKGSGNAPTTTVLNVDLKAGERYGFFILSNGYGTNGNTELLADGTAQWQLRDANGGTGQVSDGALRLWHIDPKTGAATAISNSNGHEIYHSVGTAGNGYKPNPDGTQHSKSTVDYAQGVVTIGLESGKGNNPDFADAIIKFNIGTDNALAMGEPDPTGNGGNDVIAGGEGDDKILGMAGNDSLSGGNGQDRLWGNSGSDKLYGDGGDDWLAGGNGNDCASGGQGQDRVLGQTGDDKLYGDDGDDVISGDDGNDQASGGNNNDQMLGGKGNDQLSGDAGDDQMWGDTGNDTVSGGEGKDLIRGGDGSDVITGDGGDDQIWAGKAEDTVSGGDGADMIKGDTGRDNLSGGEGNDTVSGGDGDDIVDGGYGNDSVVGGKGNDVIRGGAGNDQVKGDSGNDIVYAGAGDDLYDGGSGNDTISFGEISGGIVVNLNDGFAEGVDSDTVKSFENVIGTSSDDNIIGNKSANILSGGDGLDRLSGGRGNDVLWGGSGNDTFVWSSHKDVTGENGTDSFCDTVKDFAAGDILDLTGFELDLSEGLDSVFQATQNGTQTILAVSFGDDGFVKFAVLEGVTGFDAAALYASGQILI